MGADFYEDDYYGGSYYDGGGGDFYYGYGAGESMPPDYAPGFEPIPFAPYEPTWGLELPQFEPLPEFPLPDLPFYPGVSFEDAMWQIGWLEIPPEFMPGTTDYFGKYEVVPDLPDVSSPFYGLPYIPDPFLTPYTPYFPEIPAPQPPSPRLPGYCPTGTYHPIDDPYSCVPFPANQTQQQQQQQQKPQQQSGSGSSSGGSKQQQQQQACPSGYCKHPTTGQCIPIPQGYARHPQTQVCTPAQQQQQQCPTGYCKHPQTGQCLPIPNGYFRHPQTQVCTAQSPQASPLPIPDEAGDLFSNLKELPWWVWAALGGLLLLGKDDDGKTTTVRYRRAS